MRGSREQGSRREKSQIVALWVWKGYPRALAQFSPFTDVETEAQNREGSWPMPYRMVVVGLELVQSALTPRPVLALRALSLVRVYLDSTHFYHCQLCHFEQINKALCASVSCSVKWRYALTYLIAFLWRTELMCTKCLKQCLAESKLYKNVC